MTRLVHTMSRSKRRETLEGLLFASPLLLGLITLTVWPVLRSLYISFTRYDLFTPPVFIGVRNYSELFQDHLFWQSLRVTTI